MPTPPPTPPPTDVTATTADPTAETVPSAVESAPEPDPLVEEFMEFLSVERNVSPRTLINYQHALMTCRTRAPRFTSWENATADDFRAYLFAQMKQQLGRATIRLHFAALRSGGGGLGRQAVGLLRRFGTLRHGAREVGHERLAPAGAHERRVELPMSGVYVAMLQTAGGVWTVKIVGKE